MALDPRINLLAASQLGGLIPAARQGFELGTDIRNAPLMRSILERQKEGVVPDSAAEREFEMLTQGLSPEEVMKAQKVRLGLSPRAQTAAAQTVDIGGVPHVFDPQKQTFVKAVVGQNIVTPEQVAASESLIAESKERSKRQAELSVKTVDKSFERIGKINKNISNIDRAISALDRGAKTGAVQKFLPSITSASKELEQIRSELGLDVIGDVTFGALSQGELDLALDTALPTGLDETQLKDFLSRKKSAQVQLRTSLEEAAIFLSKPGSTVAGYLESRQQTQAQDDPLGIR